MNGATKRLANSKSNGKNASTVAAKSRHSVPRKSYYICKKPKGGHLPCPVCDKRFTQSIDVETHMYKHSKNALIEGLMNCRKSLAERSGSGITINSSSKNGSSAANKAQPMVDMNHDRNEENSTDVTVMTFSCDICQSEFDHHTIFEAHLKSHENRNASKRAKDKTVQCQICLIEFTDPADLDTHLSEVHIGSALVDLGMSASTDRTSESNIKHEHSEEDDLDMNTSTDRNSESNIKHEHSEEEGGDDHDMNIVIVKQEPVEYDEA